MTAAITTFNKTRHTELEPAVEILHGARRRVTRRFGLENNANIDDVIFAAYGSGDPATLTARTTGYSDLIIVDQKVIPGARAGESLLAQVFETLKDALADEESPKVDFDLNGLRRITHKVIAKPGVSLDDYGIVSGGAYSVFYDKLHPVTPPTPGYQGNEKIGQAVIDSGSWVTRAEVVALEPGVVSKSRSPGPIPGACQHEWLTWVLDATSEADMGVGNTIPGELISVSDDNFQGFKVRKWTSIAPAVEGGTLTGDKYSYEDRVEVEVPGTVELTTKSVTAGSFTGTVAIAKVTPRRTKNVAATVTISIETSPPSSPSPAFDLGQISCSVTSVQTRYEYMGFSSMTTASGNLTQSAPKQAASIGAGVQVYPGCYLIGTSATGSFSYVAGTMFTRSSGGTIVSGTPMTSYETNSLEGTGATSAVGYSTTGILKRNGRPVFTTLAGVTYYEVVTWAV